MAEVKILVVEDEIIVARDMQAFLQSQGFAVTGLCDTGEKAIEAVKTELPDLILMDVMLAGHMDGVDTAALILSVYDLPVIYLTAYQDEETLARASKTGPFGYLLKPFAERELITTINIALYKHQMERRLREREERLFAILNGMAEGVVVLDQGDLVSYVNPVAARMINLADRDAVGKPVAEVWNVRHASGEEQEAHGQLVREVLTAADGQEFIVESRYSALHDDAGREIGQVIVFHDITEREKMERQLQKVQKLEALGILAGGIAHDFNNLLTAIMGNLSLARMNSEVPANATLLEEAENACLRARDLTRQLLTFSKGGAPVKKETDIRDPLVNTTQFSLKGSGVQCRFAIDPALWNVEADLGQFSQIVQNLVINAREAMNNAGELFIEAGNVTLEGDQVSSALPEFQYLHPGRYVKISVKDNGPGIPPENLVRIFDPYFSTKAQGSGLGLAICYSIAKKHGGALDVESIKGEGSRFTLYLPACYSHKIEPVPIKEAHEAAAIAGHGRILVMDDEESIRLLLSKMLEGLGYEALVCNDGQAALDLLQAELKANRVITMALMDVQVPGKKGGLEAAKEIKDKHGGLPVVLMTGYAHDTLSPQPGVYRAVLSKPFSIETLAGAVREALA